MKVVSLLSGGLDSTVLAYYLNKKGFEINALSFNYGQRHSKELELAKFTAQRLNLNHKIVDITSIMDLISNSALTGDIELPTGHYTSENQKLTVVPNRNAILLAIATGYAINIGATKLFYGAHFNDYTIYPDCRADFVKAFDKAMKEANGTNEFDVIAPFVQLQKSDLVKMGFKLGVPFSQTWSCYKGDERPCLKCGTCVERTEAFWKNSRADPLLTYEEWLKALNILVENGIIKNDK